MSNQVKVGLLATATIIIGVFGFYFLKGTNMWESKNYYYAVYDRVDGLYVSNIVVVNGFRIGRVGEMKFDPATQQIILRLDINPDFPIPDSSVAEIRSVDLLGQKVVQMNLSRSTKAYDDGDTILSYFKPDMTEAIGGMMGDVKGGIVPNIDSTLGSLKALFAKGNKEGLDMTVLTLNATLLNANAAIGRINALLDNNSASIGKTLKNLEAFTTTLENNRDNLNRILANLSSLSDSLQQANLKHTINELDKTIGELKGIVADVNAGKGSLGKLAKDEGLYQHLDSAITNIDNLVDDVKARPYRYIYINVFGNKKREERLEKKYQEGKGK